MPPSNRTALLRPTAAGLAAAAALLRGGGLVAFGTETVYGLGADATDGAALARLFAAKARPAFNPLIVHVPTAADARRLAVFTPLADRLAAAFWPGPLTLVLARTPASPIHPLAAAGLDTLALRVPADPRTRALLAEAARPIAAPSANRAGRLSPTRAAHVLADLDGRIDAVLDTGATLVGLESTVVAAMGPHPVLLRPGAIGRDAIEAVAGPLADPAGAGIHAPGMMASHYAPVLPLRLAAAGAAADEAWLGFGGVPPGARLALDLSPRGDVAEAARALFGYLRALDAEARRLGLRRIAAAPIPQAGLGLAINDRLHRAAAPRPAEPETIPPVEGAP